MIVRALDGNGDWTYGKGKNNYLSGKDAIAQSIKTRVSSFVNDCFFDLAAGLDWFTYLGGSKNPIALNLAITGVILNTENVTGIIQVFANLDPVTREFSCSYAINTSVGQISAAISIPTNRLLTESGDVLTTESGEAIDA